jgi:hypothetical protein
MPGDDEAAYYELPRQRCAPDGGWPSVHPAETLASRVVGGVSGEGDRLATSRQADAAIFLLRDPRHRKYFPIIRRINNTE